MFFLIYALTLTFGDIYAIIMRISFAVLLEEDCFRDLGFLGDFFFCKAACAAFLRCLARF